jgi:alkylation response protein AidB-like acyl-CoA dehydrogenase
LKTTATAFSNRDAWKKCGAFGVQGLLVPAEYGGLGMDPVTAVAVLERLAYGCRDNGLLFSIHAHMWTAITPLVYSGSEAQKKKYLPGRSVESAGLSSQAAAADYAEAVRLDLKFALAWARLAVQRSLLYFHGVDPRTDSAAAVKEAADQAIPS